MKFIKGVIEKTKGVLKSLAGGMVIFILAAVVTMIYVSDQLFNRRKEGEE